MNQEAQQQLIHLLLEDGQSPRKKLPESLLFTAKQFEEAEGVMKRFSPVMVEQFNRTMKVLQESWMLGDAYISMLRWLMCF